jgi:hypothetical protein
LKHRFEEKIVMKRIETPNEIPLQLKTPGFVPIPALDIPTVLTTQHSNNEKVVQPVEQTKSAKKVESPLLKLKDLKRGSPSLRKASRSSSRSSRSSSR